VFPFTALMAIISSPAVWAQEPVKLDLRCPAPCSFRQGQSIWLDLDFTASTPNRYRVLTNNTDRGMAREEFSVAEEGTTDPIAPYLNLLQPHGISLGAMREPLSRKPVTVRINLNQWIRFDRPGLYHVSAMSRRAVDSSDPHVAAPAPARSNEIAVEIVAADSQWRDKELAHIRKALNAPRFESADIPDAVRDLCNLDTPEAAVEMARQICDNRRTFFLYEFGLVRSPYPAEALSELKRLDATDRSRRELRAELDRIEAILAGKR
jgi:hypothetical protein